MDLSSPFSLQREKLDRYALSFNGFHLVQNKRFGKFGKPRNEISYFHLPPSYTPKIGRINGMRNISGNMFSTSSVARFIRSSASDTRPAKTRLIKMFAWKNASKASSPQA